MSNDVIIRDQDTSAAVQANPQEVLAQVVEAVRRDSQQSAAVFLIESAVPHGGE